MTGSGAVHDEPAQDVTLVRELWTCFAAAGQTRRRGPRKLAQSGALKSERLLVASGSAVGGRVSFFFLRRERRLPLAEPARHQTLKEQQRRNTFTAAFFLFGLASGEAKKNTPSRDLPEASSIWSCRVDAKLLAVEYVQLEQPN